jgi:hypothetical protein
MVLVLSRDALCANHNIPSSIHESAGIIPDSARCKQALAPRSGSLGCWTSGDASLE